MGCVSSKQAVVSVTPALDHSGQFKADANAASRRTNSGRAKQENKNKKKKKDDELAVGSGRGMSGGGEVEPSSFRLGNLQKYIEGEQVAAGWPAWLSSVAAEAIQGWVPLRADSYEKLEKIGQGTYSSVFRARDLDTGKIVALKKVRFDNFEPESVRFMAREIMILRRLDHPNVMKLEGLITSRLSCSIFLVFEYMEHDITGLLSCPDVKFTEAQIKCYMKQLLSGLDHCHTRSVMHRDIKGSNLLVNNEGVLKVADFGLANFCSSKQPLTSRVVTLWYRPPELLLGATDYGTSVDLWSVGSVFAEILTGKPVLQGRTEVEQLHKIFKLCGSPPEEYWKRSRLPHSTIFKPNQPYESCLREKFKDFPTTAVDLLETLLSVEPHKRCTASSALASEYFNSSPYACDPSSLPRYPPSKEIDAKNRDGAGRKKNIGARTRENPKKPSGNPHGINKLAPLEEISQPRNAETDQKACSNVPTHVMEVKRTTSRTEAPKGDNNNNTSSQLKSNVDVVPFSGPSEVSSSSGFAWAKKREDVSTSFLPRYHSRSISKSHIFNPMEQPNSGKTNNSNNTSRGGYDFFEDTATKRKQRRVPPFGRPESFDASDYEYHSQELLGLYQKEGPVADNRTHGFLGYSVKANQVDFSGPLLSQKHGVDELLEKHERHIRQATRKSWFQRAKKEEK